MNKIKRYLYTLLCCSDCSGIKYKKIPHQIPLQEIKKYPCAVCGIQTDCYSVKKHIFKTEYFCSIKCFNQSKNIASK